MADRQRRHRAPQRALIGPLVVLGVGAVAGVMLWRILMLEPAPTVREWSGSEQLSQHDRQALDRILDERHARP